MCYNYIMSKDKKTSVIKEEKSASELLKEFLIKNNIVFSMEVQPKGFVNSEDGFLMTDKPLLKISPKFREKVDGRPDSKANRNS